VKLPARLLSLALIALMTLAASCSGGGSDTQHNTPVGSSDPKAGWPKTFRVGLFGGDDAEETLRSAEPMKKLLESKLGIPVTLYTGTSYGAVVEAMRNDKVDGMQGGPFAYVLAVQEAKAEAIAVSVSTSAKEPKYDASLQPYYFSVIVTKKGSGITKLEDLKGKGFAFVDPASASGHLAPKTFLIKNGINPDKDMQTVFAGSHPTSLLSVWNSKTPAGATFENNLQNLANSGQVKWCGYPDGLIGKQRTPAEIKAIYDACPDGNIVVIAQTDPIPNSPFSVKQSLPESFKTAVREALLSAKDDAAFITARKSWYVDPRATFNLKNLDVMYNPLRDIAKLLNLDLKEMAEK
jgi:phosphonate transport system substrate-binding protein